MNINASDGTSTTNDLKSSTKETIYTGHDTSDLDHNENQMRLGS